MIIWSCPIDKHLHEIYLFLISDICSSTLKTISSFHNSENPNDNKTAGMSDLQSVMQLVTYQNYFNALKTDIHINYICNLSLYLTENRLCQL